MIWRLGAVLLLVCVVDGQNNCPSKEDCIGYLTLTRRQNDADLQPFFATTLGRALLSTVKRCCHPVIPDEEVCGFPESSGHLNDLQRRGAWPWLAALSTENSTKFSPFCGGALITRRHVLTSAHCFFSAPPDKKIKYVRLGDYNLDRDDEAHHVTARIESIKAPPFIKSSEGNDIALVKLDRDIEFNDFLRPVCLPFKQEKETFDNSILAVVGYGVTAASTTSYVPVAGTINVVDLTKCRELYKNKVILKDSMLCAGGEQDACMGDGGAPLHYYDVSTGRFYIVGIVSFGPRLCANPDQPGVYTRVTSYLEWIKNSINEDF